MIGVATKNIRYANDTPILADNANDLNDIDEASKELGLKINKNASKFMVVNRNDFPNNRILINGETIEQVKKFKYLGFLINNKWNQKPELHTNRDVHFQIKYRIIK